MAIRILHPQARGIGPWQVRVYRYKSGALLADFGVEATAVIGAGIKVDWAVDTDSGLVYLVPSVNGSYAAGSRNGSRIRVCCEVLRPYLTDGEKITGVVKKVTINGRPALAIHGVTAPAGIVGLEEYVRGLVSAGSAVMMPDVLRRAEQYGVKPVEAREAVRRVIDSFHGTAPRVREETIDEALVPRGALTDQEEAAE